MSDTMKFVPRPQYAIYKGMGGKNGAIQFSFIGWDVERVRNGKASPEGFILIEAAPTIDKNIYDWTRKISFALTADDMGKFLSLTRLPDGGEIYHENAGAKKKLRIKQGTLDKMGAPTWMFALDLLGDAPMSITLPISDPEMTVLRSLLTTSIPAVMGFGV